MQYYVRFTKDAYYAPYLELFCSEKITHDKATSLVKESGKLPNMAEYSVYLDLHGVDDRDLSATWVMMFDRIGEV